MSIPLLQTERLVIRDFVMDDLENVHKLLNEAFGASSLEDRRRWLECSIMNYRELDRLYQPPYGDHAVTLKESGQLIGIVGLVPSFGPFHTLPSLQTDPNDRFNSPEFGLYWAVAGAQRRQGYASEAATRLVTWVFQNLNVRRLVATTEYGNEASMAVMRRLGMRIEKNPYPDPPWFQVVGILNNPGGARKS